jgi:signal transduction histidine kinase
LSRLAAFIRENIEPIISEWETFARSLPEGSTMDIVALRDHAKEMLGVIVRDLEMPQTKREQTEKSQGKSDAGERMAPTAAQAHGAGRAESGFSIAEMVSEFRALRASVIHLWTRKQREATSEDLEDLTRFNEAIDQAIAESITRYTNEIGQSKELFLAILGHDLRTPLGAIITSSRFMLDTGELQDPHLALVTRIASSARRMNRMVTDLLDFTRTRFGDAIPIEPRDVDVGKILQDIVSEVTASHPSCTIEVETNGQLAGKWDPDRLSQALTNLIGNAVEHGSRTKPIRVSAQGAPSEVVITVQNEGPPIAEEQIGQIFQAMKHATAAGSRERRHHLGLGLYIVDKIVAAHGGSVDVSSSAEHGTTFTVRLPR